MFVVCMRCARAAQNRIRLLGLINYRLIYFAVEEQPKLSITKTWTYEPHMNIAPEGTSYCYVVRPGQSKTMPPQHSKCILPDLYDASDAIGKWNVILGIDGQTDEKNIEIDVAAVKTFGKIPLKSNSL